MTGTAPAPYYDASIWAGTQRNVLETFPGTREGYAEACVRADEVAKHQVCAVFTRIGRRIYDGGQGPYPTFQRPISTTKLAGLSDDNKRKRGKFKRRK